MVNKLPSGSVDPSVHTLADLAHFTPDVKNTLKEKITIRKREIRLAELESELKKQGVGLDNAFEQGPSEPVVNAPQIRINENGEMVVDNASLKITQSAELEEVFDDDLLFKKLNSNSFRKRSLNKQQFWSKTETDFFYEIISAVGTDFSLMSDYITSRTPQQLKWKYNKEEKTNQKRLDECLSNPSVLDDAELRRIAERYGKLIEEENAEKEETKAAIIEAKKAKKKKIAECKADEDSKEKAKSELKRLSKEVQTASKKSDRKAKRAKTAVIETSSESEADEEYTPTTSKKADRSDYKVITRSCKTE